MRARLAYTARIVGESKQKQKDPPKRVPLPGSQIALCQFCCLLCSVGTFSRHRVCEEIPVFRLEAVGEAENLKAVAIADGPELHLGARATPLVLVVVRVLALADNDPAHPVGNLVDGSVHARCPAPSCRKDLRPQ